MGTSTLIYIIGALLAFVIINNNVIRVTSDQSTLAIGKYKALQSRNSSNSLQGMIASQVSSDLAFRSSSFVPINVLNGSAAYRVIDTTVLLESFVKVEATTSFNGENSRVLSLYRSPVAYKGVPTTAFTYAVSAGTDLVLNGDVSVDPSNSDEDADVRVNGNCHKNHGKRVHGHIHHRGNFDGDENECGSDHGANNHKDHDNSERPFVAGDNVVQDDPVKVPYFVALDCKSKASVVYLSDKTYNSGDQLTLGADASHPVTMYIDGDLNLKDNANIKGYGSVIVRGKVTIGDCNFLTQVKGAFCVYSEDDIDIDGIHENHSNNGNHYGWGRGECHGHFFSKKHVHLHDVNVHGTVASGTDMEIDDNSSVLYKPGPGATTINTTVTMTTVATSAGRLVLYRHYE